MAIWYNLETMIKAPKPLSWEPLVTIWYITPCIEIKYWKKWVHSNTSRPGKYGHRFYIAYPNVVLQWNCFVLFQISPRYLKGSVYQHPICVQNIGLAPNRRHAIIWNKDVSFDGCICPSFGIVVLTMLHLEFIRRHVFNDNCNNAVFP